MVPITINPPTSQEHQQTTHEIYAIITLVIRSHSQSRSLKSNHVLINNSIYCSRCGDLPQIMIQLFMNRPAPRHPRPAACVLPQPYTPPSVDQPSTLACTLWPRKISQMVEWNDDPVLVSGLGIMFLPCGRCRCADAVLRWSILEYSKDLDGALHIRFQTAKDVARWRRRPLNSDDSPVVLRIEKILP